MADKSRLRRYGATSRSPYLGSLLAARSHERWTQGDAQIAISGPCNAHHAPRHCINLHNGGLKQKRRLSGKATLQFHAPDRATVRTGAPRLDLERLERNLRSRDRYGAITGDLGCSRRACATECQYDTDDDEARDRPRRHWIAPEEPDQDRSLE